VNHNISECRAYHYFPVAALHQGVPGQMPWLKSFCPGWRPACALADWLPQRDRGFTKDSATYTFTFAPSQSSQLMTCLKLRPCWPGNDLAFLTFWRRHCYFHKNLGTHSFRGAICAAHLYLHDIMALYKFYWDIANHNLRLIAPWFCLIQYWTRPHCLVYKLQNSAVLKEQYSEGGSLTRASNADL